MKRRDDKYLLDMLLSARAARDYMQGVDRAGLEVNTMLQDAVIRRLQILGEAASRISQATRAAHAGLPWAEMIGMRNRVVHEYFRLDLDVIWEVVCVDLVPLIAQLEQVVPPEDSTSQSHP
jgi:uncharacterized protein with HEPN domain